MGSLLLMAGTTGKRYVLPNSRVLLHQPLIGGVMQGPATDLGIQATEMIRVRKRLYDLMCHHTGKDLETIAKDCERDKWLDAQESIDYGVVDAVLQHIPESISKNHVSDDDDSDANGDD
jgi:ATP-dependent Clp protease protease subunit